MTYEECLDKLMREAEFVKLDVSLNMNAEYLEANEKRRSSFEYQTSEIYSIVNLKFMQSCLL